MCRLRATWLVPGGLPPAESPSSLWRQADRPSSLAPGLAGRGERPKLAQIVPPTRLTTFGNVRVLIYKTMASTACSSSESRSGQDIGRPDLVVPAGAKNQVITIADARRLVVVGIVPSPTDYSTVSTEWRNGALRRPATPSVLLPAPQVQVPTSPSSSRRRRSPWSRRAPREQSGHLDGDRSPPTSSYAPGSRSSH